MGRHTECSQEMADKANEYIENYAEHGDEIPSAVGMAVHLKVAESTLYKWSEDGHFDFSETLAFCQSSQHRTLLNKGLSGDFNATITKLALSNHGYSEKTSTEISGLGGKPIETTQVTFVPVDNESN